jgi:hypothetical protein
VWSFLGHQSPLWPMEISFLPAPQCIQGWNSQPWWLHYFCSIGIPVSSILRWLNQFRIGGRSGSALKTTNLLKPKNMDWLLLTLLKLWQSWLPRMLFHQKLKLGKSSHCWLISKSWRMQPR